MRSVPDVADLLDLRTGAGPAACIEVPHGAAGDWEYDALAARLRTPLPPDLIEFFHVNTDAGAAELAVAIARRLPGGAIVVRSRLPRTLVDCNRVLGATDSGGLTPGLSPMVTDTDDLALLRALHAAYQDLATEAIDAVAGPILLLHTYAPRSVDVQVGPEIVDALRRAWQEPERWPMRPEIDVIHAGFAVDRLGPVATAETYTLHPVTTAHAHAQRHPGRVACVEVRRDLLAHAWSPMRQIQLDPGKIARMADRFAGWLGPG